jgi:hypothetical protein
VGEVWRGVWVGRALGAHDLCAVVTFGPPQRAAGRDRRAWARDLRSEIAAMRQPEGQDVLKLPVPGAGGRT